MNNKKDKYFYIITFVAQEYIWVVKSWRIRWVGNVARMEDRSSREE
jgi:hypothetical protein